MATSVTQAVPRPHDRHDRPGRRRPFSTWMRKLTNFKNSTSADGAHGHSRSRPHQIKTQDKRVSKQNNPYPQSGRLGLPHIHNSLPSFSTGQSIVTSTDPSFDASPRTSIDRGGNPPTTGAPTICTDHEASHSMVAPSHGAASTVGTRTVGGGYESRRGDSTFSSPAPSVRSLATTLTTIHSLAQNGNATAAMANNANQNQHQNHLNSMQFSQPFPTTSMSPASAIPSHLAPQPTTYNMATANNLLTDNASILTLASSSKRCRRRSFDTDASVRALAPSSLWGASRESLPLSVLSANIEAGIPTTTSRMVERTSIYSATGIVPALNSERNSLYTKQSIAGAATDSASIGSGLLGHTKADSTTGSIAGLNSPLVSPREAELPESDEGSETEDDGTRCKTEENGKAKE